MPPLPRLAPHHPTENTMTPEVRLDAMLAAWRADVDAEPYPEFPALIATTEGTASDRHTVH
jgi:hypothetical protein